MCIAHTWSRQVSIAALIVDLNQVQLDPKGVFRYRLFC